MSDLYKRLKQWNRGELHPHELEAADPNIQRINSHTAIQMAEIIFEFDDEEEVFKMMEIHEDDYWFYRMTVSSYSDYEFVDWYAAKEDFLEGYSVFYDLNEENINKLQELVFLLSGKKISLGDNNKYNEAAHILWDTLHEQIQDIVEDWRSYKNSEMKDAAEDAITKELNDFFQKVELDVYRPFYSFKLTPIQLRWLYVRYDVPNASFKELFKKIVRDNGSDRLGGWYENSYEFRDDQFFDRDGFNRYVERTLDKIYEEIESNENFKDYINTINHITKYYEMSKWYNHKPTGDMDFKVYKVDPETSQITIQLRKKSEQYKTKSFNTDLDGFFKFVNNKQLFPIEF